jgi:hypothetical protein
MASVGQSITQFELKKKKNGRMAAPSSNTSDDKFAGRELWEHQQEVETPVRRNPRLLEYARHVSPFPKLSARNVLLILLLLAGFCAFGSAAYMRSTPFMAITGVFVLGWCCCPPCALERELRSASESAPLMETDV